MVKISLELFGYQFHYPYNTKMIEEIKSTKTVIKLTKEQQYAIDNLFNELSHRKMSFEMSKKYIDVCIHIGANLNSNRSDGVKMFIPLHYALAYEHPYETIEYLLNNGADPSYYEGTTCLYQSLSYNKDEIIPIFKLLIRFGADLHKVNSIGMNILNASIGKNSKLIEFLLENGVYINESAYKQLSNEAKVNIQITKNGEYKYSPLTYNHNETKISKSYEDILKEKIQYCLDHHLELNENIYQSNSLHLSSDSLKREFMTFCVNDVDTYVKKKIGDHDYTLTYLYNSVICNVVQKTNTCY